MTDKTMLKVENLKVIFPNPAGVVRAVEGVDLTVREGECAAIVGESGSGKSVTSLSIMKLLNSPPAVMQVDTLEFDGRDLRQATEKEMLDIRGKEMAMIFQDALTALNPVMTVGHQLDEVFIRHQHMRKKEAKQASIMALRLVGVPSPERRYSDFPHELSGGMRQRVLIAMAFACNPKLIIADEPTTALDVTIQAQVLDVLKTMQREHNTSLILITHDLSVVAHMADTVYVMYCGKIVEKAPLRDLFHRPLHPYTEGLLAAVPKLTEDNHQFIQIPDAVPNPMHKPAGCTFHPRCRYCTQQCREKMPPLEEAGEGRQVRCWHPVGSWRDPAETTGGPVATAAGKGVDSHE